MQLDIRKGDGRTAKMGILHRREVTVEDRYPGGGSTLINVCGMEVTAAAGHIGKAPLPYKCERGGRRIRVGRPDRAPKRNRIDWREKAKQRALTPCRQPPSQ